MDATTLIADLIAAGWSDSGAAELADIACRTPVEWGPAGSLTRGASVPAAADRREPADAGGATRTGA